MKIFKLITSSIITIIFCSSCNKIIKKQELNNKSINSSSNKTFMKNNLPYTSDSIKQFFAYNADSLKFVIKSPYEGLISDNFNEKDKSVAIKENDFDIEPHLKEKYFVLKTFKFSDNNIGKLIIYNTFGDSDSKVLNVQLNSYFNNNLVDQLLLDCRFTFETEYFRTFKINQDEKIEIVKYSVNNLEFNDSGDIIGEKKEGDSTKVKVRYDIDSNGKFIKK